MNQYNRLFKLLFVIIIAGIGLVWSVRQVPTTAVPFGNRDLGEVDFDGVYSVSLEDVDRAGDEDIVAGARFDGDVAWWTSVKENYLQSKGNSAVFITTNDFLSTTPDWMVEGDQTNAEFGLPAMAAGDINGDDYDDIVIGARFYDNGQPDEGRVYVFYGSPNGPSTTPDWIAEGNQTDALFGRAVSAAGDVNGDGYDDVVVGASLFNSPSFEEGRVFVYYGGASGLSCGGGCPVDATAAADWTADGNQNNGRFGRWVDTAGDVNNDGYDDILVGAWLYSGGQSDEGRVFAYYGSASGFSCGGGCPVDATNSADWMVESNQANSAFGSHVASAGDVNGDNYDDVIIGAYAFNNGENDEGMAFAFYGSASGLSCGSGCPADAATTADWSIEGNQVDGFLGQVNTAGDVNGDGYDDVIVGAAQYSNGETSEGMGFVFYGSASGLSCGGSCPGDAFTTADWSVESNQANSGFSGSSGALASAGDVNSDGYSDIIIGVLSYDNPEIDEGMAFIFLGSVDGIPCGAGCPVDAITAADWYSEVNNPGALFGVSVSGAQDVNGDSYTDVIVGASDYSNGQSGEGAAFVYYGQTATPSPTPTPTSTPQPDDTMHVGDLDGSSNMNGSRWNAHVLITVHNVSENPVVNATVSGSWGDGTTGTGSCVTDGSGQCTVTKSNLRGTVSSVSFTVNNISLVGNTYQPGSNHDPDGDSDGTVVVVFKDGQPGPTATPTPTATPGPVIVLHVGDLDGSGTQLPGNMWQVAVVVTVHDGDEAPVAGATVKGSWSGGAAGTSSCVTDLLGQCTIAKNLRGNIENISLTVTNIMLTGATYDAGANHDPDGDSNGTVITVLQP